MEYFNHTFLAIDIFWLYYSALLYYFINKLNELGFFLFPAVDLLLLLVITDY
jgi:hypothetical protein